MGVIYKATNLVNGKIYIGQTIDFKRRKRKHLSDSKKNDFKDTSVFHKAIRKYGESNFSWEIIEEVPSEELKEREIYWIQFFDSYIEHNKGYNMTLGGDNADGLVNWIKNNPDKARQNALNSLIKAQESNKLHPERHREHLKQARKKSNEAVSKKVLCVEQQIVFKSISDAEKWSLSLENPNGKKASHQHISKVCKGARHTAGGYHWRYVD